MNQDHKNVFPLQRKIKRFKISLPAFIFALFIILPLEAQEDTTFMAQLMSRMGALEDENRALRGQLEETRHELSTLNQRMETLSADVDYRLTSSESGAGAPPLPAAFPLNGENGESFPVLPSTAAEDYEKARALLEQGEYEAAEKAFSAFVGTYPKDNFAGPAQYWLGVTYFVRGQHEKAAAAFAKGYKTYPKSSKAADNLLKLVKSLSALDRKADACTILDQISADHPKFHVEEISSERKKLGCK